ncbi:Crp/Fnr family transcriptional regulator [Ornithinimicrobium pekingense]|uniref:Crp/Fnr family transcriptional regulator n=1 Tax=Ornithinimicrobium pekingense TaxID=384677 RepID=A0ABQ2F9M6_9MICO|nr:Crp/Fnr family transcriptional regulator [Ornithinimicrobium pekingense]GGK75164.1 Crp/Fnr family transcriptional regulator [Ornithinimicrobium pekingense]
MGTRHAASAQEDLCVARVPLFSGLTHDQQLEVAAVARPTRVDRGEQLYAAGSGISQLVVVHTGRVKISRLSADGHEQIVRVLGAGDFVGESAFLTGARPDHVATALEPGSMCVFRHADLDRLVREHPSIGLRMLQGVSRRLDETETRLASVISGDVSSRLAGYLLSLPATYGPHGPTVTLPLPKKDVASLLDTTPESLSRQLRRLGDSGVIAQHAGRRVTLTDVDALTQLSAPV